MALDTLYIKYSGNFISNVINGIANISKPLFLFLSMVRYVREPVSCFSVRVAAAEPFTWTVLDYRWRPLDHLDVMNAYQVRPSNFFF